MFRALTKDLPLGSPVCFTNTVFIDESPIEICTGFTGGCLQKYLNSWAYKLDLTHGMRLYLLNPPIDDIPDQLVGTTEKVIQRGLQRAQPAYFSNAHNMDYVK